MFVKNKEKIDFKYRKGTYLAVLKALSVSYVDENKVSANELLDCYGQRIDIISRDLALQIAPHIRDERVATKKVKPTPKVVETVKKEELNDKFIEDILKTISEPQVTSTVTGPAVVNGPATTDDVKVDDLGLKEVNTGDKDVDDFLNGKTDKLPEGTQIISDEEAQKLLEDDNNKKPEGDDNKKPEGGNSKPDEDNKPEGDDSKPDEDNKPKARASKSTAKAKSGKAKSGRGRGKKTPEVK